jgi:DtxR family Mn-dependent transcriptional regulator
MADDVPAALEAYLEAIYGMEEDGVPAIRARLAERVGHSRPTVTEMVRRLVAEGYVEGRGRSLALTSEGRRRAESVVRKHRLAERLLTDVIGLGWDKAHLEAGRWEHVISDEVEARLVALLGDPATCPHGNPIPGSAAPSRRLRPLAVAPTGQTVRVERVVEALELDAATLSWLGAHGLKPGAVAHVRERAPDGTLTLDVHGETVALSPRVAALVHVGEDQREPQGGHGGHTAAVPVRGGGDTRREPASLARS